MPTRIHDLGDALQWRARPVATGAVVRQGA